MPTLSKEQILGVRDLETRDIEIPEWSGSVKIQQLTMLDIEKLNSIAGDNTRRMLNAVALSLVDGDGKNLFTLEDVDQLARHSVASLKRLADEVSKLNGWSQPVEAAEKNFASAPTGASSSS